MVWDKEWAKDQPAEEEASDEPEIGTLLEEAEEIAWSEIQIYLEDMRLNVVRGYPDRNFVRKLEEFLGTRATQFGL